jgi:adenylate cyclase
MNEIERRWPAQAPCAGAPAEIIQQGYVAVTRAAVVRVRRQIGCRRTPHSTCELTIKCGAGLVRPELTFPLSTEQFTVLWRTVPRHGRILKVRHWPQPQMGKELVVDVFCHQLAGLVVAEVEFHDRSAALEFTPPSWFGREVTEDSCYSNASLALYGLPHDFTY